MAVAFVRSWKNETPAGTVSISTSPAPAANDYLIGISATDSGAGGSTTTGGAPAATLTIHDQFDCTVDGQHSATGAGKAVGNETTITFTNGGSNVIGLVGSFSGVDTTTPNDATRVAITKNTSGLTFTGSITTATDGAMMVVPFGLDQTDVPNPTVTVADTSLASWLVVQADETLGFRHCFIAYAPKATAGATTITITTTQSAGGGGSIYALRPAAGGGGATTRGTPFGHRGTAFNGGRIMHGIIQCVIKLASWVKPIAMGYAN